MLSIRHGRLLGRRAPAVRTSRLTAGLAAAAVLAAAACTDKAITEPGKPTANSLNVLNTAGVTVQAAVVLFNSDTVAANSQRVTVTATGVAAPAADRNALLARYAGSASLADGGAGLGGAFGPRALVMSDAALMRRLRAFSMRGDRPSGPALRAMYEHARATGDFGAWRRPAAIVAGRGVRRSVGTTAITATAGSPVVGAVPGVGDTLLLNVRVPEGAKDDNVGSGNGECGAPNRVKARIAAVSNRAVIAVDTRNPTSGLSDAYYASVATTFDTLVYPTDVRNFGAPVDIDQNGRIILFYTRAVNGLTPSNSPSFVGGFYYARDLRPTSGTNGVLAACAGSNAGELMYLLAPDPNGEVNGNRRDTSFIRRVTVGTAAHEFQHLINAERRALVLGTQNYDEEVWLNEGLSHIAEELNFYRSANLSPAGQPGQSPRRRLTATAIANGGALPALNSFGFQNLSRFSYYLQATEQYSPYSQNDSLETRGATWNFLRYAADRSGGSDSAFFYTLVNNTRLGLPNLAAAIAARGGSSASVPLATWFRDWAVANYGDGVAANLAPQYTHPSWVFRSVLTEFQSTSGSRFNDGVYPLFTRTLAAGSPQSVTLGGGMASYLVFSIPAGATASVSFTASGSAGGSGPIRAAVVQASGANSGTVTETN